MLKVNREIRPDVFDLGTFLLVCELAVLLFLPLVVELVDRFFHYKAEVLGDIGLVSEPGFCSQRFVH